jgi:hypothetical protein
MAEPDKADIAVFGMPLWGSSSGVDSGLERTPFAGGEHRQSKPWKGKHVTSTVSWRIRAAKLAHFQTWLLKSTAWVKVPMETVLATGPDLKTLPAIAWQQVRIISPISMQNIGYGLYEVSYEVEHRQGVPTEILPVTP